jgi:hypothetical protein
MKNFSLPRVALILWFLNYSIFSLFSYVGWSVRHEISTFIVYAAVWVVVELMFLGLIEDKF